MYLTSTSLRQKFNVKYTYFVESSLILFSWDIRARYLGTLAAIGIPDVVCAT